MIQETAYKKIIEYRKENHNRIYTRARLTAPRPPCHPLKSKGKRDPLDIVIRSQHYNGKLLLKATVRLNRLIEMLKNKIHDGRASTQPPLLGIIQIREPRPLDLFRFPQVHPRSVHSTSLLMIVPIVPTLRRLTIGCGEGNERGSSARAIKRQFGKVVPRFVVGLEHKSAVS